MKRILLLIVLLFFCIPSVFSQSSIYWRENGTMVSILMDHPKALRPNVHSVFLINFNPKLGCRPEIETMFFEGAGPQIPKRHEETKDNMVVIIDDKYSYSEKTIGTKYDNGFAAGFMGSDEMIERLKIGRFLKAYMSPNGPAFIFPIPGNGSAIEKAYQACH
ncbi:hypothetical protein [Candidatus Methylomicrobium oryzae]|uniref:hypothetical protein n=1 Tax=Candidatus Methylomicrobium oryzae TaxID=2802053 RepID=UPI001920884D|nr:hypothetical protein [Methylomicrobium sp. RS1]MBL1263633.1 hypothetical protein [Methylomicrobium sp. RS1]